MDPVSLTPVQFHNSSPARIAQEIRVELFRKTIHILVAIVPFLAAINTGFTLALLGAGTIVYTVAEMLRNRGRSVFLISKITEMASREQDRGKFVLGPITLGIGAMLALLLYPEPAATIAIFALAFGDGLSSLVGKMFGTVRIPFTGGKTIVGSATCFLAVFLATSRFSVSIAVALVIAFSATALEALPSRDLDNVILPVGTGLVASQLISF